MGVWSSSQDIIIHNYNNLKNIIYIVKFYLYLQISFYYFNYWKITPSQRESCPHVVLLWLSDIFLCPMRTVSSRLRNVFLQSSLLK